VLNSEFAMRRTRTLTVRSPFPSMLSRQIVIKEKKLVISPVEVALDDIQERIVSMVDESRKLPPKAHQM
jgi:hypothetical protein